MGRLLTFAPLVAALGLSGVVAYVGQWAGSAVAPQAQVVRAAPEILIEDRYIGALGAFLGRAESVVMKTAAVAGQVGAATVSAHIRALRVAHAITPSQRQTRKAPIVAATSLTGPVLSADIDPPTLTAVASTKSLPVRIGSRLAAAHDVAKNPLSVEDFDLGAANRAIAASALGEIDKVIYSQALEDAQSRPEVLAEVLDSLRHAIETPDLMRH